MREIYSIVLSYIPSLGMKYLILVGKVKYRHTLGERNVGKINFRTKSNAKKSTMIGSFQQIIHNITCFLIAYLLIDYKEQAIVYE